MNRVPFRSLACPKAAAKRICRAAKTSLARAQRAVARISGYRDWHDLETSLPSGVTDRTVHRPELSTIDESLIAALLASELNLTSADALYALGDSRLLGSQPTTIREQISLQTKVFRLRELPVVGRRQRAAIGRLKSPGRVGEIVILKRFGEPTEIITHQSARAACADFEFVTPKLQPELFIPMRLYLAYGAWTEPDGAKVLFSRDYCPMWRIRELSAPERVNPWERIDFIAQEWFWKGAHLPWRDKSMHEAEIDRLHDFGIRFLPKLVDALPLVVSHDYLDFREAAAELQHTQLNLTAA